MKSVSRPDGRHNVAATIRSVADKAGVSPATVSRVFNDTAPVEQSTRERILEAADELGYVPNATARSLSTRETGMFGVLLPYLTGEYYPEVIRGLDQTAQEHDRFLLLSSSHHTPEDTARALRSMYGRVDGIVVMTPVVPASDLEEYMPSAVPVVLLNCPPGGHDFSVLSIDNHEGGRLATQHLIEQGHERIAIITGEMSNYEARERLGGFHTAMDAAGLTQRDQWITSGDFTRASGQTAMKQLLEADPRPTAVFATNDYMAMGAIRVLQQNGTSVPDDIAVVGFDDIPSSQHLTPGLSTIDARMADIGTTAVNMLLERSEQPDAPRDVLQLDPVLRVRRSTDPSKTEDPV